MLAFLSISFPQIHQLYFNLLQPPLSLDQQYISPHIVECLLGKYLINHSITKPFQYFPSHLLLIKYDKRNNIAYNLD